MVFKNFIDLAKEIFGEEKTKEVQSYVHRVFKEYDDDDSGELSYEEARNFIKGIYTFFEKAGNLTEEEKKKLFGMIEEVKIIEIKEDFFNIIQKILLLSGQKLRKRIDIRAINRTS